MIANQQFWPRVAASVNVIRHSGVVELSGLWISRRPLWQATLGVVVGIVALDCHARAFGQEEAPLDAFTQPQPVMAAELFDGYVFPQFGGGEGAQLLRKRFNDRANKQIASIDQLCHLSEDQKQKLLLAARGDIARVFDRVDAARAQFDRQRLSPGDRREITQSLQLVRASLARDPFGGRSLFKKTLVVTLSPDQLAKYREADRAARRPLNQQLINMVINDLQNVLLNPRNQGLDIRILDAKPLDISVQLAAEQRVRLAGMIEEEIPLTPATNANFTGFVRYHCSRIPPEKWQPILNEKQWALWSQKLQRYESYKTTLEQAGLLPVDPDDEPTPAGKTQPVAAAAAGGTG